MADFLKNHPLTGIASNSDDTERSSLMRSMASPIRGATGRYFIFLQARVISVAAMLSVTTISVRGDFSILSVALPEKTPCEPKARTEEAPCAISAVAAL